MIITSIKSTLLLYLRFHHKTIEFVCQTTTILKNRSSKLKSRITTIHLLHSILQSINTHESLKFKLFVQSLWILTAFKLSLFFIRVEIILIARAFSVQNIILILLSVMLSFIESSYDYWTAKKISGAPGSRLLRTTSYLYSSKTMTEVFEPMVCDWRADYFKAKMNGEHLKARCVSLRETLNYLFAVILTSPAGQVFDFVFKFVK